MPNRILSSSSSAHQPSPLSSGITNSSPNTNIEASTNTAPETFFDSLPLPRIIVFDLDYTLWPFWVDTHVTPPVKAKEDNTRVQDKWGESFTFYPGVPNVLHAARERDITMSVASRTHTPDLAKTMLKNLVVTPPFNPNVGDEDGGGGAGGVGQSDASKKSKKKAKREKAVRALDYFSHMQIFPGSKTTHFTRIQDATRKAGDEVAFADMLFFDDEARNRNVEAELGVAFWLVRDGVTKEEVDKGIREWRKRRGVAAVPGQHGHQHFHHARNEF